MTKIIIIIITIIIIIWRLLLQGRGDNSMIHKVYARN